MPPRKFLAWSLASSLTIVLFVAGLNWLVDPYLIFGRERVAGFNQNKPAVDTHERQMKAYEATRVNPHTVIIGSSRSGIGLDPDSPAWPSDWGLGYNLSIVGSDLQTQLQFLNHLLRTHPSDSRLQRVVVGLDFDAFLRRPADAATPEAHGADEHSERMAALAQKSAAHQWRVWRDHFEALVTLDALRDSLLSVASSRRAAATTIDLSPKGRLMDGHLRQWTINDGAAALFDEVNQAMLRSFKPPRRVLESSQGGGAMNGDADLQALIELAFKRQVKLMLLVQPTHASRMEMMAAMGYWPTYERWKRELTVRTAAARALGADVTLWDFGGLEGPAAEPLPDSKQGKRGVEWFWDPVHYSPALGKRLLSAMSGGNSSGLGAILTPDTVEARLAQVRSDLAFYERTQIAESTKWRRLVCPGPSCLQ